MIRMKLKLKLSKIGRGTCISIKTLTELDLFSVNLTKKIKYFTEDKLN